MHKPSHNISTAYNKSFMVAHKKRGLDAAHKPRSAP